MGARMQEQAMNTWKKVGKATEPNYALAALLKTPSV